MSTIKLLIKSLKSLKLHKRNKKILLIAAVILFCLSFTLIEPTKGISQDILSNLNNENKQDSTGEKWGRITYLSKNYSIEENNLMTNTLTSLINQSNYTDDSNQNIYEDEQGLMVMQSSALLAQTNPITFISQKARTDNITYIVQEGDTTSNIAASFGITLNTLLWANKLTSLSVIRPGDELVILPVTGVLHKIKNNETISSIAKYYNAESEDIIASNNLPADGNIQIGQKLIIPDGQMPAPVVTQVTKTVSQSYVTGAGTGKSRSYPYGQCTWYVAQQTYVPWSGHAKAWLVNARSYGFKTGTTPQVGAIILLSGTNWLSRTYGHVGYVESVNGDWVTFSEMNHIGWAIKSVRTINKNSANILGYIYQYNKI